MEGEFCGVDHTCRRDPVEVEGCGGGESTTGQWSWLEYVEIVGVNGVLGSEFTVGATTQKKPGGDSTVGAGMQENMVVLAGGDSIAGPGPLVNPNTSSGGEMQGGAVMGVMGGRLRGGGWDASTGSGGAVVKPDIVVGEWSTAMVVLCSLSVVEVFLEAGVMSVEGKTRLKVKESKTYSISLGFVRRIEQTFFPQTDS